MKILSSDTQEINFSRPYKIESLSICIVVLYEITGLTKIYEKTYFDIHSLFIIKKKKIVTYRSFVWPFAKHLNIKIRVSKVMGKRMKRFYRLTKNRSFLSKFLFLCQVKMLLTLRLSLKTNFIQNNFIKLFFCKDFKFKRTTFNPL